MTDERDPAGRPTQPRSGDFEGGEPQRDRDPGYAREPQAQPPRQGGGFNEQQPDGGMQRGPRRSRYGRRRTPAEGMAEGGGGFQGAPRQAEQVDDDVENYLPSFIAGPMNGGQDHAPQHGGPSNHQPSHDGQPRAPQPAPQHNQHGQQHNPQHGQQHAQPHQQHDGQSRNAGYQAPYQGSHGGQPQPNHQNHQSHAVQQGGHQQGGHQNHQPHGGHQGAPVHQVEHQVHVPIPEEPSPEVQAAAAEFAEWEDKNPQLRGQLICNPTVKRGEPIVRGTRIPARILAAIAKMGSSVEEMLRDYPALTQEGLDAALAFTAEHPRRTVN